MRPRPAGTSWGGCAPGTTPNGFLVTGAQWQDRATPVPSGETAWRPATQSRTRPYQGGPMDFATQLDDLQQRAADAKTSAQAAVSEDRDQLRRRIDQAKAEVDQKATDARQDARAVAADARSKWAQLKADTAAKLDDLQASIDKRTDQIDANVAADDADWAVDNARFAVLDAIDARAYADELAKQASS